MFKFNQRRITNVKYLGELYMYRVVNTAIIFDALWLLLNFGHGTRCALILSCQAEYRAAESLPVPGRESPIDAVDDFFRVRLICTLLDTCGMCFDKGAPKRKLDRFLTVFQVGAQIDASFAADFGAAVRPLQGRAAHGCRLHAQRHFGGELSNKNAWYLLMS